MLKSFSRKAFCQLLMLLDFLFRPRKIRRSEEETRRLARETRGMSLYDYKGCPAGLKVRREIYRLDLDIEKRDIRSSSIHQDTLLVHFGKLKAPCLRVEEHGEVSWLDEADSIIAYLQQRFEPQQQQQQQQQTDRHPV